MSEQYDNYDPYEESSWRNTDWFCIRCGSKLRKIAKDDKSWGKWSWDAMLEDGTLYFLCDNKEYCTHRDAPLILHHPVYGYTKPAGDSYSLSWVE